jgi:hypothetical protein
MIAPLWSMVMAILLGLPFAPADVKAAGIVVRESVVEMQVAGATGWTGCGDGRCEIEISSALDLDFVLRAAVRHHELCHAVDYLADGELDGSILGWQPWAGTAYADLGPVEALGYWCEAQEVRRW